MVSLKIKSSEYTCLGQDIKRYPFDNRKVPRAPGPRTKYFERFFIVQKTIVS